MNNAKDWSFRYNIPSFCFLERARKQLKLFDEGVPESLFYAALELRMGIEARLFEYIEASLRADKKPTRQMKDYKATKLRKKLSGIDPNAVDPATLIIAIEGSGQGNALEYIPITKQLAKNHGELGGMLHFNFFKNNKYWYYKKRLSQEHKEKSLLDYRDFLEEVAKELKKANRGRLLAHPKFIEFIDKLNEEE
jgi:hypothetical protein